MYFQKLSDLAKELGVYLIAGLHEDAGEKQYNSAALIGPDGGLIGKYHKQFLVAEKIRYTPGKESLTFATSFGRIGIVICKDRTDASLVKRFISKGCDFLVCSSGGHSARIEMIIYCRAARRKTANTSSSSIQQSFSSPGLTARYALKRFSATPRFADARW